MTLWIEDPQYHKDSLYIPALAPQCLPNRLITLMEGDFVSFLHHAAAKLLKLISQWL
jgi:hypothetical protein